MTNHLQPSDYTPEGLLRPEAYQRWFEARIKAGPPKRRALIMAGGYSSRMGADKALLTIDGETLLERSIRFWQESGRVNEVLVAVGQIGHLEPLPAGVRAVYDLAEGRGPMVGLLSAFQSTDSQVLYVSAVDMPNLRPEAILPEPAGDAVVYRRNGRSEPLFGVYRHTLVPAAEKLLAQGNGRMSDLLRSVNTLYIDANADQESLFQNINTRQELVLARAGTPPILTVMGWSGSGKTTFLEKLIPELVRRGVRLAAVKDDAHGFQMDTPGKDTYRLAAAGASTVGILGPDRWALLGSTGSGIERMRSQISDVDLILAEGFKFSSLPKIEIHRQATGKPLVVQDDSLLALVTDEPLSHDVPQFSLEDVQGCADLICRTFHLP